MYNSENITENAIYYCYKKYNINSSYPQKYSFEYECNFFMFFYFFKY